MTFRARLRWIAERINALSLRERALFLLAVFAIIFLIWDFAAMQPIRDRQERVQDQLEQVRDRVGRLTASIQQLATESTRNPNAELEQRRALLEDEIGDLENRLADIHGGVSGPRKSVSVLARLLSERSGVHLVELENLPVETLDNESGVPLPGVYIHRVRLVIESDFGGVGDYLDRIRQLPPGVYWESMRLDVPEWPVNRVELILYSLAFADNWLEV